MNELCRRMMRTRNRNTSKRIIRRRRHIRSVGLVTYEIQRDLQWEIVRDSIVPHLGPQPRGFLPLNLPPFACKQLDK